MVLVKRNNGFLSGFPQFFEDIFDNDLRSFIPKGGNIPSVNIKEDKDNFEIHLAAPGLSKEDFEIAVENNILSIASRQEKEVKKEEENYTRKEFGYSTFKRSFTLPENVDAENIKANYKDGILKLQLPKLSDEKMGRVKTISIS